MFTGVVILIIYTYIYLKRTEFIVSYLEMTCVFYILLSNRDLQTCQVGQGKGVAITTPAKSTLCTLVSVKLAHTKFNRIPWNCLCQRNQRTPSSMEFHEIFFHLMEPFVSSILWVLNLDTIPWNLSFPILMTIIFNFVGWINFRKLISTLYLFVSLFHQLMFYYQYLHYTTCSSGITHYL